MLNAPIFKRKSLITRFNCLLLIVEESMDVDVNPVSPEEAEMPTKIKKDLVSDFNSARNSPRNARGRSRRSVHFTQDEKLANTAAALPCTPYNKNSLGE